MKKPLLTSATAALGGIVLVVVVGAACDTFDKSHRETVATNADWTVTAVGNLQAHGRAFGQNRVRFEAMRAGTASPYAIGDLYVAGPHDDSFADEFEEREWIWPNVVRFANKPPRELRTLSLIVKNESGTAIRWLRINTDELFLVLQLPQGSSLKLVTRRWGDATNVTVRGVSENDVVFRPTEYDASEGVSRADISVRADRIEVSSR